MTDGAAAPARRLVWDWPTRVAHWAIVALVVVSWRTAEAGEMALHRWSGLALAGVLVFRVYWGFAGSPSARFSSWLHGPRALAAYLRELPSRRHQPHAGHNPLGVFSVVAMLALLVAQVGLGLFAVDVNGIESGPLARHVDFDAGRAAARLHARMFDALVWLIGLHLAAILFYALWKRADLVGPMVTGRRRAGPGAETGEDIRGAPLWRVGPGLALAAAAVWALAA